MQSSTTFCPGCDEFEEQAQGGRIIASSNNQIILCRGLSARKRGAMSTAGPKHIYSMQSRRFFMCLGCAYPDDNGENSLRIDSHRTNQPHRNGVYSHYLSLLRPDPWNTDAETHKLPPGVHYTIEHFRRQFRRTYFEHNEYCCFETHHRPDH